MLDKLARVCEGLDINIFYFFLYFDILILKIKNTKSEKQIIKNTFKKLVL
jgi:hypothetical protein